MLDETKNNILQFSKKNEKRFKGFISMHDLYTKTLSVGKDEETQVEEFFTGRKFNESNVGHTRVIILYENPICWKYF